VYHFRDCIIKSVERSNGIWWVSSVTGTEWTYYTTCEEKTGISTLYFQNGNCKVITMISILLVVLYVLQINVLQYN